MAHKNGLTKISGSEDVPLIIPKPKSPSWNYGASKSIGQMSTIAKFIKFDSNYIILRIF